MNRRPIYTNTIYLIPVCKVNQNLTKKQEQFLNMNNLILQSLVWSKSYGQQFPVFSQFCTSSIPRIYPIEKLYPWKGLIKANNTAIKK